MFLFFRKLRHRLLTENKLGKYFLYGLGEIFLVVVGILIALQIDNWNENRKEQALLSSYLIGIQDDIKKDIELMDSIVDFETKSISVISSIDDVFRQHPLHRANEFPELFKDYKGENIKFLFHRGTSFRSIRSSYDSLISDGKSGLIKNRELFELLQKIYNEQHIRLNSIYDSLKDIETKVGWEYTYQKRHWQYNDLLKAKDEPIFLHLLNFTEMKYIYSLRLLMLRSDLLNVLVLLEREIEQLQANQND